MSVSNPAELHVQDWTCVVQNSTHVWTDGSVQLAKYPWLTLAAFAVVAEDLSLIASGRVLHWRLSSYSAELWAVLVAFANATQPLVVHSDSLTIVQQFAELQASDRVQMEWTHVQWWGFLLALIHRRRSEYDPPLQLVWCPAHLLEHLPVEQISEQQALAAGSTLQDICANRKADECAKLQIQADALKLKADQQMKEADIFARQLWLSKLNRECKKPDTVSQAASMVPTAPMERLTPRQLCPRCAWDSQQATYTWQNTNALDLPGPTKPPLTGTNFRVFLDFMNSVHWKLGDGLSCSTFELAASAFVHGWRFELPQGTICSPQAYATIIRAGIAFCKAKQIVVAPWRLYFSIKEISAMGRPSRKASFEVLRPFLTIAHLSFSPVLLRKGPKRPRCPGQWPLIHFSSVTLDVHLDGNLTFDAECS